MINLFWYVISALVYTWIMPTIWIDTPKYSGFEFFGVFIHVASLVLVFGWNPLSPCDRGLCDEHRLGPEGSYPKDVVQGSARVKTCLAHTSFLNWLGLNPTYLRLLYQSRSGIGPTEKGYKAILSAIKYRRGAQVHLIHKPSLPPFQFMEGRGLGLSFQSQVC